MNISVINTANYSNRSNKINNNKIMSFTAGFDPGKFLKNTVEIAGEEALYQMVKKFVVKTFENKITKPTTELTAKLTAKLTGKQAKTKEEIIQKGAQQVADKILGHQNSEKLAEAAKEASRRAEELSKLRQTFPELIEGRDERHLIIKRNKLKNDSKQLDLDYYKDDFRAQVTIPVQRLNNLRNSTNPELKAMFDKDKINFLINEGILIHGSDIPAKKQLLEHYISEAKKYDMEVVHIQAGDNDPNLVAQQVSKLFTQAKERFHGEKKATMFVMEDMDKMLNLTDETLETRNSSLRGQINTHTDKCGHNGTIWISTVKDTSQLDQSSIRPGRVRYYVDIDNVAKLSK